MSEASIATSHGGSRRYLLVIWVLVALLVSIVFIPAIPARFAELLEDPYGFGGAYEALGISVGIFAAYFTGIEVLFALLFISVAVVIFWKAPGDWMAVLISIQFLAMGQSTPLSSALISINQLWHWPVLVLLVLSFTLALIMFLLFPNGQFVPGWTRWLALIFILYAGLWFFFPQLIPPIAVLVEVGTPQASPTYSILVLMTIIGVGAQIYRYRKVSTTIQRQQTKWVVFGFAAFLAIIAIVLIPFGLISELRQSGTATALGFTILFGPILLSAVALIPLSISLAILRHRLWDISFVVRRTLVYGLLSIILALVYFISVVALQNLFSSISEQRSPIAVVISTLIIAALFSPLRKRIQELIDRRFYRRKYDASLALDRFARTARDEVDLNRLILELEIIVQAAMQPDHTSIWLVARERRNHEPPDITTSGLH